MALRKSFKDPPDRPTWSAEFDNPYLRGLHTPVTTEATVVDLEADGEIPRDLYGAYLRTGPNPVFAPPGDYHWFDGDGMVHGLYFRDGKASYIRKWVKTPALAEEIAKGGPQLPGVMGPFDLSAVDTSRAHNNEYCKDTGNTDIIWHNRQLLALWYNAGAVNALDPQTLDTSGLQDFGGALDATLSAHPKVDRATGELLAFDYGDFRSDLGYYVFDAAGRLAHKLKIDLPGPRLPHDLSFTTHYTILHDFPLFHDAEALRQTGRRVLSFHRDMPTRYAVVPRYGSTADIRWFEFEPGYVLHMVNAWEEGDWIVMDGCFQPDPSIRRDPAEGRLGSMLAYLRYRAHLRRWRMNLRTGEVREEQLDDLNVEFCLPDTNLCGVKTRYSYHQLMSEETQTLLFKGLVKYDHETLSREICDYGPGNYGTESPFAPREGAKAEDDGYVLTLVTNEDDFRSNCFIFNAQAIGDGPVAKVRIPLRVPTGFHAKWVPGGDIWP